MNSQIGVRIDRILLISKSTNQIANEHLVDVFDYKIQEDTKPISNDKYFKEVEICKCLKYYS